MLGYVPTTCLLGGVLVWLFLNHKQDPCKKCNGPREKCGGRPRATFEEEHRSEEQARLKSLLTGD